MIKRKLWGDLCEEGAVISDPDVVIVGIPYDSSACYRKGAAFAPTKLRDLSRKSSAVTEEGIIIDKLKIMDIGDLEISLEVSDFFKKVTKEAKNIPKGVFVLALGGDHSVTIPLIQAYAKREKSPFGLIYLDAHLDLWDSYDNSPYSHACSLRRALELPDLDFKNIVAIGMRCFNPDELHYAAENNLLMINATQCARISLGEIARQTIERMSGITRIYLSIDIDILDPAFAPGTGIPKPGGVSTRFLLELLKLLLNSLPITAADLVEISPPNDCSDITSFAGVSIIFEILGQLQQRRYKN